ncbi:hypothetical protein NO932_06665 [Pelagibacterium sp. 26DY04]|uniref:hypothetical protein n=1 Tax=Pelagibacterium sp. 26DY04 TaxID=2967130 RepID=UPI002815B225|nr:hypothetical protein [Pelagibacterium sp. 26DY04]WMT88288.1 hypothetical protein NO932_06665 [Pelagibacterium sp. 26DY04]
MNVPTPKWRFEWNLNTVAIIIGFAVMIGGWGYNYSDLVAADRANAQAIEQIRSDVAELSATQRTLDNHELRLTAVETQARETVGAMRTIEQSLNSLSSDIRVMREIIERMERSQASVVAGR